MELKEFTLKAIAPTAAVAVLAVSGVFSALASFIVGDTPVAGQSCNYGYDAGYGYGYDCTPKSLTGTSITGNSCDARSSKFDTESQSAYLFACVNDITTKNHIDNSLFQGVLIRKEMAKMISNYAINVMGLTPDTSKTCDFNDIANEDTEMKHYIKTACQLGLMGYKGDAVTKADVFNPNQSVNRAMFGTLFARMLYGSEYAAAADASDWYSPSLNALKADNILTVIDPTMTEVRGYVWIVFDRAANN